MPQHLSLMDTAGPSFIHFWNLCFWQRAVLGSRGPFVPLQLAASTEVQRATGPQCMCVYVWLSWQQSPLRGGPPLRAHMPALVNLPPRSHERGPLSTWPVNMPPHTGPVRSPHLGMLCQLPFGLRGDNTGQSLRDSTGCSLQKTHWRNKVYKNICRYASILELW